MLTSQQRSFGLVASTSSCTSHMQQQQQQRQQQQPCSARRSMAGRARRAVEAHAKRGGLARELLELQQEKKDMELESVAPTVTELSWQSPLRVLRYPDPRLRALNAKVGVFDGSLRRLADEMFDLMYQDDGVGLAAPQVGVNVRMMVFNPEGVRGKGEEVVLVNPRMVSLGKATDVEMEGCLSFPGMEGDVERSLKVKIRAQDASGKKFTFELEDWAARIFQHEYDHLQGTLFHDRMAPGMLATVRPRLVQLEEDFLAANPGTEVRRVA